MSAALPRNAYQLVLDAAKRADAANLSAALREGGGGAMLRRAQGLQGDTALHLACHMHEGAEADGWLRCVVVILHMASAEGPVAGFVNTRRQADGATALAVLCGRRAAPPRVRPVRASGDGPSKAHERGSSERVGTSQLVAVAVLLLHGADPKLKCQGRTPREVHISDGDGDAEVVHLLANAEARGGGAAVAELLRHRPALLLRAPGWKIASGLPAVLEAWLGTRFSDSGSWCSRCCRRAWCVVGAVVVVGAVAGAATWWLMQEEEPPPGLLGVTVFGWRL